MEKASPCDVALHFFPPEMWASIGYYLAEEQLKRLKMTGSKWLWSKLKTIHAVKSVILGKECSILKNWPVYLNELPSIEELVIYIRNDIRCLLYNLKLNMVPQTLRKLKIFATQDFTGRFMANGEGLQLATHLPLLETLEVNMDLSIDCCWLAPSPPNLTCLKMAKWHSGPLPSTLIHLSLEANYADTSLWPIPPCLESLSFPNFRDEQDLVIPLSLLPSTLRLLHIYPENWRLSADQVANLPKGLTELNLNLDMKRFPFPELQTAPQQLLAFPQDLTSLVISELPSECWSYLPQTLRSLSIRKTTKANPTLLRSVIGPSEDEVHEFYTLPIHTLPRSITDLYIDIPEITFIHFGLVSFASDSFASEENSESYIIDPFPPFLTSLFLPEAQLSVQAAKALPASLTYLRVLNMDDSVCEHIPRRLLELWIDNAIMTEEFVKFLPRSLTALYITNHDLQSTWIDPTSCKVTVAPEAIRGYQWEREAVDEFIPLLPDQLLALRLNYAKKVTGKSFKALPKHLTYLELSDSKLIFDSDILDLPRCLRTLILDSAVSLTNKCADNLPLSLERLELMLNTKITRDVLSRFNNVGHG